MGCNLKIHMKVDRAQLTDVLKNISVWDGKTRLLVEGEIKKGTKDIKRYASQRVNKSSSKLKKSLKTRFKMAKCEGHVFTKIPYAHIVEYGAKSHEIKAKNKKSLRFIKGNREIFAKKVNVPKYVARPYLKPAYDYISPNIVKNMKRIVKR